ncbi:hypothetical protein QO189_01895 [Psychrobacter sp. Arc29]|uniref:hypothetical protein n=1 Tax=Psychrobacter sp. Arc29 TaxID=3046690 RepID=UPI00352BEC70
MSIADFNNSRSSSVATLTSGSYTAIRFTGSAANTSVRNEISLEFQNSSTSEPLFLNKVALSVFDIDKLTSTSSYWDDNVKFVGTTQSNAPISGVFQTIANSSVINTNGEGLRLGTDFNCGSTLESTCQGSVVFSEPVKSVKIIYTNTNNDVSTNITSRIIDFRLDSYCYQPASYEITKDDGISSIGTSSTTNYIIKVTNNGNTPLSNIILKDPIVTGLTKQDNITCDTTDNTNTCTTAPTKTQLESTSGFTISSLATGKTYSIKVPTRITASEGSTVTNTATIQASNLELKSASDTNTVTSIFSGGSPVAPASCPSGHKMFYIGSNPPSYTPKETLPIGWTSGELEKTYTFNKTEFKLSFTNIVNLASGYPSSVDVTNTTSNALNMFHNSFRTNIDHRLTATINKPVSKYGFVVQDLDANEAGQYIESISLASPGGVFSRIESKPFQLSNGNQTISGTAWDNCNTVSPCNFNIDWGYKSAQTPFAITHGNPSVGSASTAAGAYVVGYSDFYFCLAPPKLIVKKSLSASRVNDTDTKRDQFEIKVTGNALDANTFTTTGTANTITNGTSDLLSLAESTTYTITENVINGTTLGDVANYNATYACTNATTNSTTVMPTVAMSYDATNKTRSFTLANVNYGDEITCTITNSPATYNFSGFVFNDNGGITASSSTQYDTSATFTGNGNYANGVFDSNESGIYVSGLQVRLTDCSGNNLSTTSANPQTVSNAASTLGQYSFTVLPNVLLNKTKVCIIETEPNTWEYPIDTTADSREVTLASNVYDYKTEKNTSGVITRNLDFGELKSQNATLVLKKSQYVHQCNASLNYTSIGDTNDPNTGFSMNAANNVKPGNCIAYKIDAYNRGHIDIVDVQIKDILQTAPVISTFQLPKPTGNPSNVYQSSNTSAVMGNNGTIVSDKFDLVKVPTATTVPTKASLYFNSKYGTTTSTP